MPRLRLCWLPLLAGCGAETAGPAPQLDGEGFFGAPWPDDARRVDGLLDLDGFPGTGTFPILDKYLAIAATLDGFGTNAPLYVPFEGPLDADLLPDAATSETLDSPVLLVNVDPHSPGRGELVPFSWDLEVEGTSWQPANLLAIQPVWGFPLRASTTYAVVVRTSLASPAEGFAGALDPLDPRYPDYADVAETLEALGVPVEEVALATRFTTQDPADEMRRIAAVIQRDLPTPPLDQALSAWDENGWYTAYEGTARIPSWQHGDKPYFSEGGGFRFTEDGTPTLAGWEDVLFTFTVPVDADQPEGGWPVVLNAHGTGGDDRSHADGSRLCPAAVLAREGAAILEIAQPLHGDRGTGIDPTLVSFNFLNPESARATFRQGSLDLVYLARLLTARQHCFDVGGRKPACTDPTKIAFLGHSQGGITGAMAAPFWRGQIHAAVFSGAGGGLSITMLQRDTTEFDINALLSDQLDLTLDELDLHHPLVALIQTLSEVTDPLNYGRYWVEEPVEDEAVPLDVLMTEGTLDQYTPPPTIEALAGSAGLPALDPMVQEAEVATLRGLGPQDLPAEGNLRAWDDTEVTGGLAQYEGEDHFPIFELSDAARLYRDFLLSSLDGDAPVLEQQAD